MAIVHFALAVRDVPRRRGSSSQRSSGGRSTVRATSRCFGLARVAPGQEVHLLEVADYSPSPFEREYGRHIAVSMPRASFRCSSSDSRNTAPRCSRQRGPRPSIGSSSAMATAMSLRLSRPSGHPRPERS